MSETQGAPKTAISIQSIVDRWTNEETRPEFAHGALVDVRFRGGNLSGKYLCRCAQGDILFLAGWDDDALRRIGQSDADEEVANLLGIPLIQAVMLREVNDAGTGNPESVLSDPNRHFAGKFERFVELEELIKTIGNNVTALKALSDVVSPYVLGESERQIRVVVLAAANVVASLRITSSYDFRALISNVVKEIVANSGGAYFDRLRYFAALSRGEPA